MALWRTVFSSSVRFTGGPDFFATFAIAIATTFSHSQYGTTVLVDLLYTQENALRNTVGTDVFPAHGTLLL